MRKIILTLNREKMTCKQNNLWKNVLALVMLILLCPQAKADVQINAENFPDPNFRNYVKNVMWQHNGGYNTFSSNPCYDGVITDAELALLTVINMEGRGSDPSKVVTDMTGVQLLTTLERLNLVGHQVRNLDLSGMTNLNTVYATSNQLEEVNVSGCTSLRTICVMNNQIGTEAMGRFVESLAAEKEIECCWHMLKQRMQKAGTGYASTTTQPVNGMIFRIRILQMRTAYR